MVNISRIALRALRRVRSDDRSASPVRPSVLFGWYIRKGLGPAIRGILFSWRFKSTGYPVFIGRRTNISYARQMTLGRAVFIGADSTILAFSRTGVVLEDRVTLREHAWIQCSSHPSNPGAGLTIREATYIGPNSTIGVGGPVEIGAGCQIGANCTFIAENHAVEDDGIPSKTSVVRLGIKVGDNCWIGHGVTILDGVQLGDGCVVGAGAVVTKSFPPNSKIAGVPAKQIG